VAHNGKELWHNGRRKILTLAITSNFQIRLYHDNGWLLDRPSCAFQVLHFVEILPVLVNP